MRSETVKAVQNQWDFCSITKQQEIILRYFDLHGKSETGRWLKHLAEEFGLDKSNTIKGGSNV